MKIVLEGETLEEQLEHAKRLIEKYRMDKLTGLYRRDDFDETITRFISEFNSKRKDFLVALVDLNDLHNLNYTHGYDYGDDKLVQLADSLLEVFDKSLIYRIGGDEFAILCRQETYESIYLKLDSLGCRDHIEFGIVDTIGKDLSHTKGKHFVKEAHAILTSHKREKKIARK